MSGSTARRAVEHERTDAGGSADLVRRGAEGDETGAARGIRCSSEAVEIDGQLPVGRDGVDVQRHAGVRGEPRDLLDRLDRADLVVGPQHGDEGDG